MNIRNPAARDAAFARFMRKQATVIGFAPLTRSEAMPANAHRLAHWRLRHVHHVNRQAFAGAMVRF